MPNTGAVMATLNNIMSGTGGYISYDIGGAGGYTGACDAGISYNVTAGNGTTPACGLLLRFK